MNTCKTCKHWAGKEGGLKEARRDRNGNPIFEMFGRCEYEFINAGVTIESVDLGSVGEKWLRATNIRNYYPHPAGCLHPEFYTGPNFGCVHHEEK